MRFAISRIGTGRSSGSIDAGPSHPSGCGEDVSLRLLGPGRVYVPTAAGYGVLDDDPSRLRPPHRRRRRAVEPTRQVVRCDRQFLAVGPADSRSAAAAERPYGWWALSPMPSSDPIRRSGISRSRKCRGWTTPSRSFSARRQVSTRARCWRPRVERSRTSRRRGVAVQQTTTMRRPARRAGMTDPSIALRVQ